MMQHVDWLLEIRSGTDWEGMHEGGRGGQGLYNAD